MIISFVGDKLGLRVVRLPEINVFGKLENIKCLLLSHRIVFRADLGRSKIGNEGKTKKSAFAHIGSSIVFLAADRAD